MRFNKKASLEIGVNTIVILVIAMTLLGLGVVFVRNLFDQVGGTVDMIEPGDIASPPTSDQPIKLVPSTISMKAGKSKEVQVLVYNKKTTQKFDLSFVTCTGLTGTDLPVLDAIPEVEIESGAYVGFTTLIHAKLDDTGGTKMTSGRYICQLIAEGDSTSDEAKYSEQFIMDVTA